MNFKKNYFLILFIFSSSLSFSQKTKVNGTIVDIATNEPIPFVSIIFKGTSTGTFSDSLGMYSLETKQFSDSIQIISTGYKKQTLFIRRNETQRVDVKLESDYYNLKEVAIRPGKNPAFIILDSVIANRLRNGNTSLNSYQWESYDKFQIYFGNYTDHFSKRKQFKNFRYIFDYADSTDDGKPIMPIFMSETISRKYSVDEPPLKKSITLADKSTVEKYEALTLIANTMVENVNIYENFFPILGKSFISPVNTNYQFYYRYYLVDSLPFQGYQCYKILFSPKWKSDFAFSGEIYIDKTTWAVVKFEMKANDDINLNYVNKIFVSQEFIHMNDKWILEKSQSSAVVKFYKNGKNNEFTIRRTTSNKDFIINNPEVVTDNYLLDSKDSLNDPLNKTDAYWALKRHDSLRPKEKYNYIVADTIRFVPMAKKIKLALIMLATGYVETGPIGLGQWQTFYSRDPIEENRFKFGIRTNKYFHTKMQFGGYAAYGTKDKEIKYKAFFMYVPKKDPNRFAMGTSFKYDINQMGVSNNHIPFDNILASRHHITNFGRLTFIRESEIFIEKFWSENFSNKLTLTNTEIRPLGELVFQKMIESSSNVILKYHDIVKSEVHLNSRISFNENYYATEFARKSLGSKYPIINLDLIFGFKNILQSDYNYQKVKLNVRGKVFVNPIGYLNYNFEGGKTFGSVPYILLELHPGNQTLVYDKEGFNLMNYFEFVSDEYASFHLDHHFEGFFLNKIPLIQRAKLREVVSFNGVAGNLHQNNINEMILPIGLDNLSKPYTECSAGIENIFKVFRIDYVWRLTNKSSDPKNNWSIKGQFYFSF